ncbi:MAG: hypothetical protein PHI90_08815 [Clostridia bacterium]|nr:hypothetical protein [Clostridia bacterium]MDD4048901.1 hypothetical protein [Clostridia bacterium]
MSLIIQRKMNYLIVDGIKYEKLGDDEFYAQELFESEELFGYLTKNMTGSEKSVYKYVVYDSDDEEKLYFVIETKGKIESEELRSREDKKIECGKKHF